MTGISDAVMRQALFGQQHASRCRSLQDALNSAAAQSNGHPSSIFGALNPQSTAGLGGLLGGLGSYAGLPFRSVQPHINAGGLGNWNDPFIAIFDHIIKHKAVYWTLFGLVAAALSWSGGWF